MEEVIAHIVQPISWVDVAISVCSLVISAAAVVISLTTYWSQKEHNKNSVRPILNITFGDYENDLYIRVDNNGVGPAIVAGVTCTCCQFSEPKSADSLIGLMPYQAVMPGIHGDISVDMTSFTDFVENIAGRTIAPGDGITLLRIKGPTRLQLWAFRNFLRDCCVEVQYTDIYDSKPWTCKRSLEFFGRTLGKAPPQIQYFTR